MIYVKAEQKRWGKAKAMLCQNLAQKTFSKLPLKLALQNAWLQKYAISYNDESPRKSEAFEKNLIGLISTQNWYYQ
jgi:hypothetical protein